MKPTNRPAPLACVTCPHALTAAKPSTVPKATRLRRELLAAADAPCAYLAAVKEAQR